MFHKMHCGVHITVAGTTWKSGLAEESGHKCHWKDKHCDIETKHAGTVMTIESIDYDKKHGQVTEQLIGFVELGVATFLVPCEQEIEVFHDKHEHKKKAGHILIRSEFIPIPI